jgi:hypothetical protein
MNDPVKAAITGWRNKLQIQGHDADAWEQRMREHFQHLAKGREPDPSKPGKGMLGVLWKACEYAYEEISSKRNPA